MGSLPKRPVLSSFILVGETEHYTVLENVREDREGSVDDGLWRVVSSAAFLSYLGKAGNTLSLSSSF